MTSYQTIIRTDEKTSLLGSDYPRVVVEHCHGGSRCVHDPETGYRQVAVKRRRLGCCAFLCRLLFWIVVGTFILFYVLRGTNTHIRLPKVSHGPRHIVQQASDMVVIVPGYGRAR